MSQVAGQVQAASYSAVVLLVAFGRVLLMETPAWLRIGRGILTAFGAG